jgi:hypothetical protein
MNGPFGVDSSVNTSMDDIIGDLFARDDVDDNTVMDSIIGATALDDHLQIMGPLGDESSKNAQDEVPLLQLRRSCPFCVYNAPIVLICMWRLR